MAVNRRTLREVDELRTLIARVVDARLGLMAAAWAQLFVDVTADLDAAVALMVKASRGGRWPGRRTVNRILRDTRVLDIVATGIEKIGAGVAVEAAADLAYIVRSTARSHARIIASQLPDEAGSQIALGVRFDQAHPAALDSIVRRSTEQITALSWPLPEAVTADMKRSLVRGVAMGENPRRVAAEMVNRSGAAFNGGLQRAAVIARTEMLDAHRSAAAVQHDANAEALRGWVWMCSLGRRTCPACWSMHGTEHPLDEPGPNDHQAGRCSRTPLVKSWAELGFEGIPEPDSAVPDAEKAFYALPEADQLAIMGPGRLAALRDGRVGFDKLATLRDNPGWRPAYYVRPISDF